MTRPIAGRECRACAHFRNDPAYLEATVKGLTSLSSGNASVRSDDGICRRLDRHVGARSGCQFFTAHLVTPPDADADPRP